MKKETKKECTVCHSKDYYYDARGVWHCNKCEMNAEMKKTEAEKNAN